MKRHGLGAMQCVLVAVILIVAGCGGAGETSTPNVATVRYQTSSGAIPPDQAWVETYTVASTGTVFTRSGVSTTTTVNAGEWTLTGFGTDETALFNALTGHSVYTVHKTGQGTAPPVSRGTQIYTIAYDNNTEHEVVVGDGSQYNNPDLVTASIDGYIAKISLPAEAVSRFKSN